MPPISLPDLSVIELDSALASCSRLLVQARVESDDLAREVHLAQVDHLLDLRLDLRAASARAS